MSNNSNKSKKSNKSSSPEINLHGDVTVINSMNDSNIYSALKKITRLLTKSTIRESVRRKITSGRRRSTLKQSFNYSIPHVKNNLVSSIINICRTTSDIKVSINKFISGEIDELPQNIKDFCDNVDEIEKVYKNIISQSSFDEIRDIPIYLYSGVANFNTDENGEGYSLLGLSTSINPYVTFQIDPNGTLLIIKCKLSDLIIPILKLCKNLSIKKYGHRNALRNEEEIYIPPKTKFHVDKEFTFEPGMKFLNAEKDNSTTSKEQDIYVWNMNYKLLLKDILEIIMEKVNELKPLYTDKRNSKYAGYITDLFTKITKAIEIYVQVSIFKDMMILDIRQYNYDELIAKIIEHFCKKIFNIKIPEYLEEAISDSVLPPENNEKFINVDNILSEIKFAVVYNNQRLSEAGSVNNRLTYLAGEGNSFKVKMLSIIPSPENISTLEFLENQRANKLSN